MYVFFHYKSSLFLIILLFQSLYVFRIVTPQELDIIVTPFTQKFDAMT
jgi:hypothetical protein